MPQLDAVKIVESFWADVWAARNPDAIDRYVVDDFAITSGGVDIRTRDSFKQWVREFQSKILDLTFETIGELSERRRESRCLALARSWSKQRLVRPSARRSADRVHRNGSPGPECRRQLFEMIGVLSECGPGSNVAGRQGVSETAFRSSSVFCIQLPLPSD